jgi:hypothetical protein
MRFTTLSTLVFVVFLALLLPVIVKAQDTTGAPAQTAEPRMIIQPASTSSSYPFFEPCPAPTADRSINICTPPDGVFLTSRFLLRAKVTDSFGLKGISLYVNGVFEGSAESIPPDVSIFFFNSPGTYRISLLAKDSQGYFKKTINIAVSPQSPCPASAVNDTMRICSPAPNETVSSPVHISGVATDSADAAGSPKVSMTIYVDGQAAEFTNGQYNNGPGNVINSWILLVPGTHRITIQHHDQTGRVFGKTETINVQ